MIYPHAISKLYFSPLGVDDRRDKKVIEKFMKMVHGVKDHLLLHGDAAQILGLICA
jgi:hypothetical protein